MKSFCRGWCSAHLCNQELRCEDMYAELTSLNKSEVIEEHWYCRNDRNLGDSIFNRIDRSDENITNTLDVSDARIDSSPHKVHY